LRRERGVRKRRTYSIICGGIIIALAILSVVMLRSRSKTIVDEIATSDIARLQTVFDNINQSCQILSFDRQKNPIDFLTVKSFVGSEVGPMNLAYPKRWQGPYVQDNPDIKGIYYQVVVTDHGHFITPGDGVTLSDGKVIGTDIPLDKSANIQNLIKSGVLKDERGKALAAPINVRG